MAHCGVTLLLSERKPGPGSKQLSSSKSSLTKTITIWKSLVNISIKSINFQFSICILTSKQSCSPWLPFSLPRTHKRLPPVIPIKRFVKIIVTMGALDQRATGGGAARAVKVRCTISSPDYALTLFRTVHRWTPSSGRKEVGDEGMNWTGR